MSILADYGCNEQTYLDQAKHRESVCPAGCPNCGGEGCLIGHGYYQRKAKGADQAYLIWIKRWFCKNCRRTLSVIPNFLLPHRQYLVRIVQAVVAAFYESLQSWERVTENCAKNGTPGLRTMQRWCKALARYAPT
jgi:transposase-like protein